jgi:hypothetical protein
VKLATVEVSTSFVVARSYAPFPNGFEE